MILIEEKPAKEDAAKDNSQVGWGCRDKQGERSYRHSTHCDSDGHEAQYFQTPWEKITKRQEHKQDKGKAPESAHYIVVNCNIGVN